MGVAFHDNICHINPIDHGLYRQPSDSTSIMPGEHLVGYVCGTVNQNVADPVVTNIKFSMESDYYSYTGCLCHEYIKPELVNSALLIGYYGLTYLPGDAAMRSGDWPPAVLGNDVTYLVNYFRGLAPECLILDFYAPADVNGDCRVIGSDVTVLVNYFRAIGTIDYCPDYPPAWPTPDDLPTAKPESWPACW